MKNPLHLIEKIAHKAFDLLQQYWPFVLIAALVALILMLCVLRWVARQLRGRPSVKEGSRVKKAASKSPAAQGPNVLASLRRLSPEYYTTFSDLYLHHATNHRLTHLDHVVVSRQGIFVIQVEAGDGELFGATGDKVWIRLQSAKSTQIPNPIWRNACHVRALAHFLGQPEAIFRSVIFFPGAITFKLPAPDNVLTSGLGRYIAAQPIEPLLTDELVAEIKSVLATASQQMDRETLQRAYQASKRKRASPRTSEY